MNWLPVDYKFPDEDEDYKGIRTHSRYLVNLSLATKSKDISINLKRPVGYIKLDKEDKILKKLEIVKYTLDSIKTDKKFSDEDNEFMPLALSWLWIKGYYIVFHLASLLIALEKSSSKYIFEREYNEHSKILALLNSLLTYEKFLEPSNLNLSFNGKDLKEFKILNHENLKEISSFEENLYKLTLKKIYKEESKVKLRNLRREKRKRQLEKLNTKIYSLFDVFLYYREYFNYLDIEGKIANELELAKFYKASYKVIVLLSKAFIDYFYLNTSDKLKSKFGEIRMI